MLEAKGFKNVVVNLTGETADVVIPEAELSDAQRAQIEDIVKRKMCIRDRLSNGWANTQGLTIGVVDERSELAGCYQGIPQNDLGMRTDCLLYTSLSRVFFYRF